jgi:hypothetical protein
VQTWAPSGAVAQVPLPQASVGQAAWHTPDEAAVDDFTQMSPDAQGFELLHDPHSPAG